MKFKREIYILGGTAILVIIVLAYSSLDIDIKIGSKKKQDSSVSQNIIGPPQAPVIDSMADHHKPKPAESAAFDNLLGKPALDFTLESHDGQKYTLSSLKGRKVILFFNEGLMCYPACWNQIAAFGGDKELSSQAVILNINVDPKEEWKKAIDKMPELSSATVLHDPDRSVSKAYGVLTLSSSMHRGQFPGHTYVVIDNEGIVRMTRDDSEMAVRNKELESELAKI